MSLSSSSVSRHPAWAGRFASFTPPTCPCQPFEGRPARMDWLRTTSSSRTPVAAKTHDDGKFSAQMGRAAPKKEEGRRKGKTFFSGLVYLCGRLSHRTTFLYCFLDHSVPPPRHHTSGTPGNVFFLSDTQRLLATLPNAPEVYFTAYAPLSCESVTFEAPPALLLESPLDPPSSSSIRSAAAAPSLSMSKPVR